MIGLTELGYGAAALFGGLATYVGTRDKGRLKADQQDHQQLVELVGLLNNQLKAVSKLLTDTTAALHTTQATLMQTRLALQAAEAKIAALQERVANLQATLQETQTMYRSLAERNEELEKLNKIRAGGEKRDE